MAGQGKNLGFQRAFPRPVDLPRVVTLPPPAAPALTPTQTVAQSVDAGNDLHAQNLVTNRNVFEMLRLQFMGQYNAPITNAQPNILGNTLAVAPNFTAAYKNTRDYVIAVRVVVQWNTAGGWILLTTSKGETATQAGATYQIINGVTQNNQTQQIFLQPGETLFIAAQAPANGGVALAAQDLIQALVTDPSDLLSGQARRFSIR